MPLPARAALSWQVRGSHSEAPNAPCVFARATEGGGGAQRPRPNFSLECFFLVGRLLFSLTLTPHPQPRPFPHLYTMQRTLAPRPFAPLPARAPRRAARAAAATASFDDDAAALPLPSYAAPQAGNLSAYSSRQPPRTAANPAPNAHPAW